MDMLRRIFGLQPATDNKSPEAVTTAPLPQVEDDLEGTTAPLANGASAPRSLPATPLEADPGATGILDDHGTRRLPEYDTVADGGPRIGRRMSYGLVSDVGQVRVNNQDAVMTFVSSSVSSLQHPEFGVFIVADGMGGHEEGEVASATAARTVANQTYNNIFIPLLMNSSENDADRPTITEIMRDAIQEANNDVSHAVPDGGTTFTGATIIGDLAYIGHVGDSRAYMITQDGIEQLTRDHSLVQRLIELDQLTPEEAAEHPQRNVLYRAIGQNESIDVDAITRRLTPGSRLLICSDGLWNMIPEEEIKNTVYSSPSPQAACEALVKLANSRGGPDNISVIIVRMPD
jgi:PPM family protein phosphatase